MKASVFAAIVSAALFVPLSGSVAAGAPPEMERIDLSVFTEDETAFASEACGFPVEADLSGHVITTVFSSTSSPVLAIDRFNLRITYTNASTGETAFVVDAGPDIRQRTTIAVIGRSTTGSGVIGRVVFDADTDEILFEAGHRDNAGAGAYIDAVCDALAP